MVISLIYSISINSYTVWQPKSQYYTILVCITESFKVRHCTTLYHTKITCNLLYYIVVHCSAVHCSTLQYTLLNCTTTKRCLVNFWTKYTFKNLVTTFCLVIPSFLQNSMNFCKVDMNSLKLIFYLVNYISTLQNLFYHRYHRYHMYYR